MRKLSEGEGVKPTEFLNILNNNLFGTITDSNHSKYRCNTDNNAKCCQQRTQFIYEECFYSNGNAFKETHHFFRHLFVLICLHSCELFLKQITVYTIALNEFSMPASFNKPAIVNNENFISIQDR